MASAVRMLLGTTRITFGTLSLVSPCFLTDLVGLGDVCTRGDQRAIMLTRLFGSRDLALGGALFYFADQPKLLAVVLQLSLVMDALDFLSYVAGYLSPQQPRQDMRNTRAILLIGAGALAFVFTNLWLLSR
eukprot:m.235716 g.235716  ORF g.235716 m.235716 type:complete len:131 (-) comp20233_c0_seq1:101-493(-)